MPARQPVARKSSRVYTHKDNPQKQRVIMCTDSLWKRVVTAAKRGGISASEYVREALTHFLDAR